MSLSDGLFICCLNNFTAPRSKCADSTFHSLWILTMSSLKVSLDFLPHSYKKINTWTAHSALSLCCILEHKLHTHIHSFASALILERVFNFSIQWNDIFCVVKWTFCNGKIIFKILQFITVIWNSKNLNF